MNLKNKSKYNNDIIFDFKEINQNFDFEQLNNSNLMQIFTNLNLIFKNIKFCGIIYNDIKFMFEDDQNYSEEKIKFKLKELIDNHLHSFKIQNEISDFIDKVKLNPQNQNPIKENNLLDKLNIDRNFDKRQKDVIINHELQKAKDLKEIIKVTKLETINENMKEQSQNTEKNDQIRGFYNYEPSPIRIDNPYDIRSAQDIENQVNVKYKNMKIVNHAKTQVDEFDFQEIKKNIDKNKSKTENVNNQNDFIKLQLAQIEENKKINSDQKDLNDNYIKLNFNYEQLKEKYSKLDTKNLNWHDNHLIHKLEVYENIEKDYKLKNKNLKKKFNDILINKDNELHKSQENIYKVIKKQESDVDKFKSFQMKIKNFEYQKFELNRSDGINTAKLMNKAFKEFNLKVSSYPYKNLYHQINTEIKSIQEKFKNKNIPTSLDISFNNEVITKNGLEFYDVFTQNSKKEQESIIKSQNNESLKQISFKTNKYNNQFDPNYIEEIQKYEMNPNQTLKIVSHFFENIKDKFSQIINDVKCYDIKYPKFVMITNENESKLNMAYDSIDIQNYIMDIEINSEKFNSSSNKHQQDIIKELKKVLDQKIKVRIQENHLDTSFDESEIRKIIDAFKEMKLYNHIYSHKQSKYSKIDSIQFNIPETLNQKINDNEQKIQNPKIDNESIKDSIQFNIPDSLTQNEDNKLNINHNTDNQENLMKSNQNQKNPIIYQGQINICILPKDNKFIKAKTHKYYETIIEQQKLKQDVLLNNKHNIIKNQDNLNEENDNLRCLINENHYKNFEIENKNISYQQQNYNIVRKSSNQEEKIRNFEIELENNNTKLKEILENNIYLINEKENLILEKNKSDNDLAIEILSLNKTIDNLKDELEQLNKVKNLNINKSQNCEHKELTDDNQSDNPSIQQSFHKNEDNDQFNIQLNNKNQEIFNINKIKEELLCENKNLNDKCIIMKEKINELELCSNKFDNLAKEQEKIKNVNHDIENNNKILNEQNNLLKMRENEFQINRKDLSSSNLEDQNIKNNKLDSVNNENTILKETIINLQRKEIDNQSLIDQLSNDNHILTKNNENLFERINNFNADFTKLNKDKMEMSSKYEKLNMDFKFKESDIQSLQLEVENANNNQIYSKTMYDKLECKFKDISTNQSQTKSALNKIESHQNKIIKDYERYNQQNKTYIKIINKRNDQIQEKISLKLNEFYRKSNFKSNLSFESEYLVNKEELNSEDTVQQVNRRSKTVEIVCPDKKQNYLKQSLTIMKNQSSIQTDNLININNITTNYINNNFKSTMSQLTNYYVDKEAQESEGTVFYAENRNERLTIGSDDSNQNNIIDKKMSKNVNNENKMKILHEITKIDIGIQIQPIKEIKKEIAPIPDVIKLNKGIQIQPIIEINKEITPISDVNKSSMKKYALKMMMKTRGIENYFYKWKTMFRMMKLLDWLNHDVGGSLIFKLIKKYKDDSSF